MERLQNSARIHISPGSVFKAALVLILLYVLFLLKDLVFVVLTAVVIASAIAPGTGWLVRHKIPRLLAVILIYLAIAVVLFAIFYFLVPPLLEEMTTFLSTLPEYISSVDFLPTIEGVDILGGIQEQSALPEGITRVLPFKDLIGGISNYISRIPGGVFATVSAIFGGFISFVLIIIISFYLSVQEGGIDNFLRVIIPYQHQEYVVDLWHRAQTKIGRWMQGQLLLGVIVAVLVFLGLTILGVEHAFLFAVLAGVFELIPLFGPVLASIPAIIIGFIDGGVTFALLVAGFYIIIQQFENHLIYPLVVHKVVGVPALLVILALIIGGQLAGFLGIILAVPVATALMEFTNDIEEKNRKRAAEQKNL